MWPVRYTSEEIKFKKMVQNYRAGKDLFNALRLGLFCTLFLRTLLTLLLLMMLWGTSALQRSTEAFLIYFLKYFPSSYTGRESVRKNFSVNGCQINIFCLSMVFFSSQTAVYHSYTVFGLTRLLLVGRYRLQEYLGHAPNIDQLQVDLGLNQL
jgi:hypothetical protein